jgi:hypothetical protein
MQLQPDFVMWQKFDTYGNQRPLYNQVANTTFFVDPSETNLPRFVRMGSGQGIFGVQVNPQSPVFTQLGVRYFVMHAARLRARHSVRRSDTVPRADAKQNKALTTDTRAEQFLRCLWCFVSTSLTARQRAAPNPCALAQTNAR